MTRALKWMLVHLLYGTGALQLWLRIALRRRAVVLMYHRVLPVGASERSWSHPAIVVSPETFERHLRVLRGQFRVLSAAEFQERLAAGRFESRSCLITFDDGWSDTYREAWPMLRKHRLPALVFLPSAYIGSGDVFWQERLGRVLFAIWRRARRDAAFAQDVRPALAGFGLEPVLDLPERGVRMAIMDLVRRRKADASPDPFAPVRALARFAAGDDSADGIDTFIDWTQAREMAADGITFGAHGVSHRLLTTLSHAEVASEVAASRDAVQQRLGTGVTAFCYPNGAWDAGVAAAVSRQQYAMAFSTERGHVDARSNRFALRRMNMYEQATSSTPMFLARVLGVI